MGEDVTAGALGGDEVHERNGVATSSPPTSRRGGGWSAA